MNNLGGVASVVGIGHTDWPDDYARVRAGEKPFDSYGYAAVALKRALDDAGLKNTDIDGLLVGHLAYERAAEVFGISSPRWGGTCGAVDGVVQAAMVIASGLAEVVALVYGNDQRSAKVQYGGPQAMGGDMMLSYVYHAPWGLTSQGALYALMQRRYMELTGATCRDLGQVAVARRQWASTNSNAVMRKPISLDDYVAAEFIADPLKLYDYCMINDGGVAIIIAEAGRAKKLGKRAVPIQAIARADMNEDATSLKPRLIDFYRPAQKAVADQVYAMAGAGPDDMDGVLIYDSFSCHVLYALEGFGFCGVGEAGRWIAGNGIGPGGKLPVNSHGGHLSESYMQGWSHQLEAVRRLRGEAPGPQYERCRRVQYISDVGGKVFSIIYGS